MNVPPFPIRILFLCTGNSCRSQMAEGFARHLKAPVIHAQSAGIVKHGLNPLAVRAMADAGVDISGQSSKTLEELPDLNFDYVITLCGNAKETCPRFPGRATVLHRGFDDPPQLAQNAATEAEALAHYARVRDEIRAFIISLPQALDDMKQALTATHLVPPIFSK
ncbi:arsenate reductase ArsC [Desulfobaculum sp. SPO524]|uniref:arsenate reductase ArsC n=1 Tax=Desulfobaculum sp. SPO524 TaxID=3378071 RepID=UPI0038534F51